MEHIFSHKPAPLLIPLEWTAESKLETVIFLLCLPSSTKPCHFLYRFQIHFLLVSRATDLVRVIFFPPDNCNSFLTAFPPLSLPPPPTQFLLTLIRDGWLIDLFIPLLPKCLLVRNVCPFQTLSKIFLLCQFSNR